MKALLWKESREIVYKVLIGLGACVFLLILRLNDRVNYEFSNGLEEWSAFIGVAAAVALAVDLIAQERSKGTLAFLLGHPVRRLELVGAKFLVGLVSLLVLLCAYWGVVYLVPVASDPESMQTYWFDEVMVMKRLLTDVGYFNAVVTWFSFFALFFSVALLGSALSDNSVKALAAAGLIFYPTVVMPVMLLGHLFPAVRQFTDHIFSFDIGSGLHRIAYVDGFMVQRLCFVLLVSILLVGGVYLALGRLRVAALGWKTIVGAWIALALVVFSWGYAYSRSDPQRSLARISYETEKIANFVVQDGLTYVASDWLSIIDMTDPTAIKEVGRSPAAPLWRGTERLAVAGNRAYLIGKKKGLPTDSLGVAVFDVSSPTEPTYLDQYLIGPASGWIAKFAPAGSGLAAIRDKGEGEFELVTLALGADGVPVDHALLKLTEFDGESRFRWRYVPDMNVVKDLILVSMNEGVRVFDPANVLVPKMVSDLSLDRFQHRQTNRRSVVDGERLFVNQFWPKQIAVFDIADPARPKRSGTIYHSLDGTELIANGHLYHNTGEGLRVYKVHDEIGYVERVRSLSDGGNDAHYSAVRGEIVVDGGYAIVQEGRDLVFYAEAL